MKNLKSFVMFAGAIILLSIAYYVYLAVNHAGVPEKETLLSEIGEVFGELGLWLFAIIYLRTLLKLGVGRGSISERFLPEYIYQPAFPLIKKGLIFLNRTHIYVGIATISVVALHIALMGLPIHILFFPAVLALVIWQGLFGFFISWRYSPKEIKKYAYLVHAQLITGVMIGVFAYFGHLLIED